MNVAPACHSFLSHFKIYKMLALAHGRLWMKLSREQETCQIGPAWALDPALRRGSQLR